MRESSDVAFAGETERQELIKEKWKLMAAYQQALQGRHRLEGGSLNYGGRLDRLLKLLREDVKDAYLKASAAALGLKHVYDIDLPMPPISRTFLESFLIWTRDAIRKLEINQQDEIEFEHIVYLVQARGDGNLTNVAIDYDTRMAKGNDGKVRVDLTNYFAPAPLGRLWVRGVGLSFSDGAPQDPLHRLRRVSAQIFPPPAQDLFSDPPGLSPRSPVILTNIAMTDPNQPARLYRGANVNNLDPRGVWTIQVNGTLGYPDRTTYPRTQFDISDVKLHLLLAARPNKSVQDWPPLFW